MGGGKEYVDIFVNFEREKKKKKKKKNLDHTKKTKVGGGVHCVTKKGRKILRKEEKPKNHAQDILPVLVNPFWADPGPTRSRGGTR